MKKFLVVLVVLAMTCFSAVAFAADISVSGSIEIRSRDFQNLLGDKNSAAANNATVDTQERVRLNVDATCGDNLKGRLSIENDWDKFGRNEQPMANNAGGGNAGFLDLREAWIDFMLPDLPVGVKVGHQLLQLGQGWFYRAMHFGSDAWLIYNGTANNTLAFVDVKASEGSSGFNNDDVDAYVILDVYKLDDKNSVGFDFTALNFRETNPATFVRIAGSGGAQLDNLGLNYTGDLGMLKLKAEADIQMGSNKSTGTESKFKGKQLVLQGTIPMDALSINATLAYGSGNKVGDVDTKQIVTVLDIDPHYTFLYEYKVNTAAGNVHTGFANTTAVSVGAGIKAGKSLDLGVDLWYLKATEKTNVAMTGTPGADSDKLGTEIDAKINWKLYDNLSWNWNLGYFKPGDAYKNAAGAGTDAITGIQGVLSYKF